MTRIFLTHCARFLLRSDSLPRLFLPRFCAFFFARVFPFLDENMHKNMAGMPLFAHVRRGKLTPPPHSAPLKPIKLCGSKTPKPLFKVPMRRRAPGWFLPVSLRKTGKNTRKAAVPRFCPHFVVLPVCFAFPRKLTHRPSGLIKFPMPVARYEKKQIPPWTKEHPARKPRHARRPSTSKAVEGPTKPQ